MVILGYWYIRGLGAPFRYLLEHSGIEWEDRHYTVESKDKWFEDDKLNLGLPCANLPYLIDGDIKVCQSLAVAQYLGRKLNMLGKNEAEHTRVDIALMEAYDARTRFSKLCYDEEYEKKLPSYKSEDMPNQFARWNKFFDGVTYVAGDSVSVADFLFYEVLDIHLEMVPGCLDNYPNVKSYYERTAELDGIKRHRASDKFSVHPINSPFAKYT